MHHGSKNQRVGIVLHRSSDPAGIDDRTSRPGSGPSSRPTGRARGAHRRPVAIALAGRTVDPGAPTAPEAGRPKREWLDFVYLSCNNFLSAVATILAGGLQSALRSRALGSETVRPGTIGVAKEDRTSLARCCARLSAHE